MHIPLNNLNFNRWQFYILIILLYFVISFVTNEIILTDSYFYSDYGSQLTAERIEKIISSRHHYAWVTYVFVPIYIYLKTSIVALIIFAGAFLFDSVVSFADCFRIALVAELAPLLSGLIRVVYFLFYPPVSIKAAQMFSPLSISQFIDLEKIPSYFMYPIQLLNVFEVLYWSLLIICVASFLKVKLKKSLQIVATSYGISLVIWVLLISFITLQFS